jgi:hypothetical protein
MENTVGQAGAVETQQNVRGTEHDFIGNQFAGNEEETDEEDDDNDESRLDDHSTVVVTMAEVMAIIARNRDVKDALDEMSEEDRERS